MEKQLFKRFAYILFVISVFLGSARTSHAQYDINQFFFRGQRALSEGKFGKAIDNYNIILRLDSSLYEAYFFRGIAKYNLGDFTGAELDMNRAIEINPVYTIAYHYRAIIQSRLGKFDLALKDFEEAVNLRPNYAGLYFSRGVTYFLSQQFEKAVEDFDRFIRQEPREADAYLNRGASYLYLQDTVKALKDYNRAITLRSLDPEGYIRRSRIYYAQHKYEKAIRDLDKAIELDTLNAFAYFNRALMKYDGKDIAGTLADFEKVLKIEPNNALTLYNRALIRSQLGDYHNALDDYDKVLNINPDNVLVYYNRAILFMELNRYRDAMDDFTRAIELYPDFAKAYMSRSYVKTQLGLRASAEEDYNIAQEKIRNYVVATADSTGRAAFADTSRKYDRLLALDSDFAKNDFNDQLLQNRNVNIDLKPMYRFDVSRSEEETGMPLLLTRKYQNRKVDAFLEAVPLKIELNSQEKQARKTDNSRLQEVIDQSLVSDRSMENLFAKAMLETDKKQFNAALAYYDEAIKANPEEVFLYFNRGVLQSDMIEFISSIESNIQVLTLDNSGNTRARVQDQAHREYDYSASISDMKRVTELFPEFPYAYYNLGNLHCLSGNMPQAVKEYTQALSLYPYIGEAFFNRGLVLIYMKDKEKGCLDLSKAGELGVEDAYSVIKKYCTEESR